MTHFTTAKLPHLPNPIDNPQLIDYRNAVHYLTRLANEYSSNITSLRYQRVVRRMLRYKRVVDRLEWQAGQ